MAYGDKFNPAGTSRDVKIRGPLWAAVFSLVTLGIYSIYWIYATAKDLSQYGKAKGRDLGQNPTMTLLAITLGWLLLFIPPIVAFYRQAKRIQQAQHLNGVQPYNGWLALVLYLVFSPAYFGYVQSELNKAWAAEGGPVPQKDDADPPRLDSAPGDPLAGSQSTTQVGGSPERPGA
jgi:hypothetical protein